MCLGGVHLGGVCPGVSAFGCLHRRVSAQGGVPMGGVCLGEGVCLWRGGRCLPTGSVCLIASWDTYPTPVNRITDRSKNITLPQTSFAGGINVSECVILLIQLYFLHC